MYFLCRLKATNYSPLLCQFSIAFCWLFFLCFFLLPKVVFEGGSLGFYEKEFLVAVDNVVFLTDECRERPSRYNCSRSSSENDTSRYIFSPIHYFYYDYYDYHSYYHYKYYYRYGHQKRCTWTLSAPYGNIIKLRFIEFQLEDWFLTSDGIRVEVVIK
ncbi:PREDICTED: uncharacterized protein LOC107350035 [Acropora digitifera]|uniref:uncharacterized protein LOC107350035 n=1 Tax=Acropora digitifera TaxID=70779 RepID=UPI00077ADC6A|nr:PREDICTED: uncharacterized protein LOC107350035 [Acropora digitifera]